MKRSFLVVTCLFLLCSGSLLAQAPVVSSGGVVNGASFRPSAASGGGVAPGSIISIFGTNLARSIAGASALPLPTTLVGTSVTMAGRPVPLFFVSPNQINAQVPWAAATGSSTLTVTTAAGASAPAAVTISAFSPGIFAQASNGRGPGAIQNWVTETNTPLNDFSIAAPVNGMLIIYATGLGAVQNPPADGAAGSGQRTVNTVSATIGGRTVTAEFAGLTPGFAGLYQVNARVPSSTAPGNEAPLFLLIGGRISNTVTLAVR